MRMLLLSAPLVSHSLLIGKHLHSLHIPNTPYVSVVDDVFAHCAFGNRDELGKWVHCGLHFITDGKGGRHMPGGDDADGHGEPADMVTRSRDPNAPAPTKDGVLCGAIQVASDREG